MPCGGGDDEAAPDKRTRWILAALFAVGFLLTIVSLYVAFTPARSLYVAGVQGRYFTVVMPLLFLAVYGLPIGAKFPRGLELLGKGAWARADRAAAGMGLAALALFAAGLILSYHVPCGSEYYRWSLCNQPQYKNWAPESVSSPPISSTMTLTQEIVPACDGMTELRVWVNSNGGENGGTTRCSFARHPGRRSWRRPPTRIPTSWSAAG